MHRGRELKNGAVVVDFKEAQRLHPSDNPMGILLALLPYNHNTPYVTWRYTEDLGPEYLGNGHPIMKSAHYAATLAEAVKDFSRRAGKE